jgi:hypothetical protein
MSAHMPDADEKQCHTCGGVNPAQSVFCYVCGARLSQRDPQSLSSSSSPMPRDTVQPRQAFCPHCGGAVQATQGFCGFCGAAVRAQGWEIEVRGSNADEVEEVTRALSAQILERERHVFLPVQTWDFVESDTLKAMLQRDYSELDELLKVNAPKSVLIMCGSILEAVLVSILRQQETAAKNRYRELFPDKKNPERMPPGLDEWRLYQLIAVSTSQGILKEDSSRLHADIIRDYRNLVHPMAEVRQASSFDPEIVAAVLALFVRILRLVADYASTRRF